MKKIRKIHTDLAPKAIGPYSQAVGRGAYLFTSGQIPLDPETGKVVGEDIKTQTRQVLENLTHVLLEGGSSLEKVVKTTCFLTDMKDFADFNQVYAEYFSEHHPARSCIAVKELPLGVLCEVEAIGVRE